MSTTPYDLESIAGYPKSLQIYRIPASRFWQVRMFVDRKYVRKSTHTEVRREAIEFAKQLYDSIKISQRLDIAVHTDTFYACSTHLMKRQEALVQRGERDKRLVVEDQRKLRSDILPFFGHMGVANITAATIDDYVMTLTRARRLSPSTIKKHLVVVRKVLVEAQRLGFIKGIPPLPSIRKKDTPRPFFTLDEYRVLRATAKNLAARGEKVRGVPLTDEIYDFIVFAVNVFVRPSDLKLLKHKHIRVETQRVGSRRTRFLSIIPANSKTVIRQSISMPVAAVVYDRILERATHLGLGGNEDYVFFPQYPNREYAMQTIRRQFEYVLKVAELRLDQLDRPRTLYSLRHSALMYRFLKAENIDIFMLAKNALTSVDQLERFYLSHAVSKDKIASLHS